MTPGFARLRNILDFTLRAMLRRKGKNLLLLSMFTQVIIADEPTAHLDTRLSAEFMETVGQFREQGRTVIIASHDPLVFGSPWIDSVVEMRDGILAAPAELHPAAS